MPSCVARAPIGTTSSTPTSAVSTRSPRLSLVAADIIQRGRLAELREARYAGWDGALGRAILDGTESLESLEAKVASGEIDPTPVSGQQELLENVVNQSVWSADRDRVTADAGR